MDKKNDKKLKDYKCVICNKDIDPGTIHIGNIYNDDKKCLKCGLGITKRVQ
jgi:hypothetical protein